MGVACRIRLSPKVQIEDVATVISILLGNPKTKRELSEQCTTCEVEHHIIPSGIGSECATIAIPAGTGLRQFLYHFEFDSGETGARGIMPTSTAANIALGVELVKFFGGDVDFNDCDEIDVDFSHQEAPDLNKNDDANFISMEKRFFALKPLTGKQIKQYEKIAAYKL